MQNILPSVGTAWLTPRSRLILERAIRAFHPMGSLWWLRPLLKPINGRAGVSSMQRHEKFSGNSRKTTGPLITSIPCRAGSSRVSGLWAPRQLGAPLGLPASSHGERVRRSRSNWRTHVV